jgi:putative FmdB family regulatory protein
MPVYEYQCSKCSEEQELFHSVDEVGKIKVKCTVCNSKCTQVIRTSPNLSIAPQHQACGSMFDYHNIDPATGRNRK